MKLSFLPTCDSMFSISMACDLAHAVQSVCLSRDIEARFCTWYHNFTVEGDIPDDVATVIRCVHRFVGDGSNGRRTCGFVLVCNETDRLWRAKTELRWEHKNGKWSVKYKNGRFTAIGKDASMKVALDNLFVAFKPSPLTDRLGRATVVA